ncbi:ABC transporter ATP-binding protein [Clostridium sp. Marseille-P299]|uniref:ABC transporter ATP-binding protein n=1 Tax=Clostridium sp. Marseille-P299 TaxID=1805477 RepID=UPI0008363A1C|nr:ABC transporter ATP-binding protein [Clostridium sp. Marseille-P299]
MRLNYKLSEEQKRILNLKQEEQIQFCVPYDLESSGSFNYVRDGFVIITEIRFFVMQGVHILYEYELQQIKRIVCKEMVNCGAIIVDDGSEEVITARFSMRYLGQYFQVAQGAENLSKGIFKEVVSKELDRYCEQCGRVLPGTRECPYCSGRHTTMGNFLKLIKDYRWRFIGIAIFMIIAAIAQLYIPEWQKRFIDDVLVYKNGDYKDILFFIVVMLVLTIAVITIQIAKNWWCVRLGAQISKELRSKLFHKIQILSLSFQERRKPGDLMNRVVKDTVKIRRFMENVFGNVFSALVTMIGALAIMLRMNFLLTLASLVFFIFVLIATKIWKKKIKHIFRMQRIKEDKLNSRLQDVISGIRLVKSYGKEQEESEHFNEMAQDYARVQKNNEVFFAVFYPILTFVMGLGLYFVTYFGGKAVLLGTMSAGELLQFITYTGIIYGPLGRLTQLPRSIMEMLTSLERIYDILEEEPQIQEKPKAKEFRIKGDIDFEDVCFGYKSYEPVLEEISLQVKQGEMIGIVGASGTGKSTLINLIMRLYDVDSGSISIDGINICDMNKECLHSQIGVVLQENFLFSGSILNNIRFAKQDASFEDVIRAAKAAGAHDFICKTPDGYHTYVGEHGYNLSGGERQRIAIARAILSDPRILILDEATSALDTESEFMIQQALKNLTKGKTTFAIAHRLSTLKNADRLIVIDKRKISEIGTHNELLEKKGIYYHLVMAQLRMQGS